ncbi:MAG: phasin family protein [Pseudomonadales bacterium]
MPRSTKSKTQTTQASAREALDPIAAFNGAAAETFVRTCQAYTNGANTMNAEMMSFMNNRMNRDIEFTQAMSKCENWSGVVDVQQKWAQQATEEYFAEANKLVQLATKLTEESLEPVYEQANQTLAELKKPLS